jgi:hypothetical protein
MFVCDAKGWPKSHPFVRLSSWSLCDSRLETKAQQ